MKDSLRLWNKRNILLFIGIVVVLLFTVLLTFNTMMHQTVMDEYMRYVIHPIQRQITEQQNQIEDALPMLEREYHATFVWLTYESDDNYLPTEAVYQTREINEEALQDSYQRITSSNQQASIWRRQQEYFALIPFSQSLRSDWLIVVIPASSLFNSSVRVFVNLLLMLVLVLLAVFLLFGIQVIQPLQKIRMTLLHLSQNNYQIRLPIVKEPLIQEIYQSLGQVSKQLLVQSETLSTTVYQRSVLINHLILGIIVIDSEGKVILSNPAANAMLDIDEKYSGMSYTSVIKSYPILSMIEQVRQTHQAQQDEVEIWMPQRQIVDVNIVPYGQKEHTDEVLILLYDLTEIRRLEEVRSEFVANASHELRTPVTAIKGFAETLQQGALDHRAHAERFVNIIAEESQRLEHIIEDILELSRIEKQQVAINISMFDLVEKIQKISSRFNDRINEKQMHLILPQEKRVVIETDEQRFEHVLSNLIENAINYSDAGSEIKVRIEESTRMIRLSVSDQGEGISEENQARIFERFYRVDKARSRQTGGTGLGLSIVRHLVKTMNGTISVKSKLGEGSTFTVRFPKFWGQKNINETRD